MRSDRLRALNVPYQVAVELGDEGLPVAVNSEATHLRATHRQTVESVGEIWRIDDEWWRAPIHRRYVEAILEGGKHVVLFEDLMTGEWWMQKP